MSAVDALVAEIGRVPEDCSNVNPLPTPSFTLGGQSFDLGPDFYVMRLKDDGKEVCQLGIQGVDAGGDFDLWILGDPFLRKYYPVYDWENGRVGFALAKQPAEEAPLIVWVLQE
eukprot:UN4406